MEIAIYILAALSAWHYLWDGILAQSFRIGFRFELFALRDRVREMRIEESIDANQFRHLEDSLNTAIQAVRFIDLTGLVLFQSAYKNDGKLRLRIDERIAFVESMPPEARDIYANASLIVYKALVVNIGAWLIPLATVYAPIYWACSKIEQMVSLTEHEAARFVRDLSEPTSVATV